jgi:uncharacterized membrane protein YhfC
MLVAMHALSASLMILIPLVLGVLVVRRWRLDWAIFGLGALTFIGSQILHIPFNQFVLGPLLERLGNQTWTLVVFALAVGLSAGVFEETARYLVLGRIRGRVTAWREGVLYGLGHGGIEAIILGGFSAYALVQAVTLRGTALEGIVPSGQVEVLRKQLEAYWGMAWYEPLWATLERLSAMTFHVFAALLVLRAVVQKRLRWLGAAILLHTLFNTVALVAVQTFGVAATELSLAAIGLICGVGIFRMKNVLAEGVKRMPPESPPGDRMTVEKVTEQVHPDRLDDSRYTG